MYCPKCKTRNPDDAIRCAKCGTEFFPGLAPDQGRPVPSPKALLSVIAGGFGMCLWIIAGIPAIVLGFLARRDIRRSGGRLTGQGLATAGIVLGVISCLMPLVAFAVLGLFFDIAGVGFGRTASVRKATPVSNVTLVRNDMRSLATAIEAYYVDNNAYPAFAVGFQSVNASLGSAHPAFGLPTFSQPQMQSPGGVLMSLTTPIAYITTFPRDVGAPAGQSPGGRRPTFLYWCVGLNRADTRSLYGASVVKNGAGWILVSTGPDGDYDLAGEWDVYDPTIFQPSARLLGGVNKRGSAFTYDPTNGTVSNGDIWRVKQ